MSAPTPATTFPALLERRLRDQPGSPLVTFYDDASGERTELSVTSYVNWAAKHANLWRDELDLDDDATVLVDLPVHWLVPVVVGGAWHAGLAVSTDAAVPHDVVVTDVAGAARHAGRDAPEGLIVLACSLHPFALPTTDPLPAGVLDHGHLWPGQSDVFVPVSPVTASSPAWRDDVGAHTMGDLLGAAAPDARPERLLTTRHPAHDRAVPDLLAPLLGGGSVVYVRHADESRLAARVAQEGVTRTVGSTAQPPTA